MSAPSTLTRADLVGDPDPLPYKADVHGSTYRLDADKRPTTLLRVIYARSLSSLRVLLEEMHDAELVSVVGPGGYTARTWRDGETRKWRSR